VKKSELKKRLIEALTPDEASKVDAKYKEIYAGMVGKNPLKMKKYDNPDKVAYGRAINLIQKESLKLAEKLGKKAKVGDYIEDFTDSDAPQFKGKSDKKKKQMAVAAFLNKEEQKLDEIDAMMEDAQEKSEKNYSNYFKKMDKNRLNELVKAALMNPKKADLNKDGKLSDYEKVRATAIEKSINKVDETEIKYSGKTSQNIEKSVDSIETFAEDILRHIEVVAKKEKGSGNTYLTNPKIKEIIKDLETLIGENKSNLKSVVEDQESKVDETEVNEIKMMDFAKLAKKVKNPKEFIKKIADILGNQSPDGEKALERMYNTLQTLEESKEETLSERIFKELRK
jgi:hypothetical protein